MTKETMTVHKALAELKTIDDRINKAINEGVYVLANKHSNDKISGVAVTEFKSRMKAAHNKVTDLINRRNAIKRAVVLSNAQTKIKVGGIEYTIAEAIDAKNNSMVLQTKYISMLSAQLRRAQDTISLNSGEPLERKAEQHVLAVIQAQPKDSKMAADSDVMQSLRKAYIENNTYDLIDPLEVAKLIEAMSKEFDEFMVEIDSALSVSNALTIIEIEY